MSTTNLKESFAMVGDVEIKLIDRKDNDRVLKRIHNHNLIVAGGRELVIKAISGQNTQSGSYFYINKIGVGEKGGTVPVDTDTALTNPLIQNLNPATDFTIDADSPDKIVIVHTLSLKDFSGISQKTVKEAGLFYEENGKVKLFSRYVFPELNLMFNSTDEIAINIVWTISAPAKLA